MSISVVVMAHTSRLDRLPMLAEAIGQPFAVAVDDGTYGENRNGDNAWATHDRSTQWSIVLQDDAELLPNFTEHAARALADCQPAIVSFYVGTSRPRLRQRGVAAAIQVADDNDLAWLTYPALLWGVAVAIPTDHIDPMLHWAQGNDKAYDRRLGAYAQHAGLPVMYCWPSLVDHFDGPGIVRHTYSTDEPRRAWRVGTRDHYRTLAAQIT